MPTSMRMAISGIAALGLVMLALALSGISAMAEDLERATPLRAPAPATEQVEVRSRQVDCPLPAEPQRPRI